MATPKSGYTLPGSGERVPGTTTVIGRFKDSGGLLHWAFAQGRLAEQGKIQRLYDKAEEAADIGTQAHELIEVMLRGGTPDLTGRDERVVLAFTNAMAWLDQTRIEILPELQEVQLVCPRYRFGGTPDAIGRYPDGRLVLLDWKTSNGVYPDYLVQLAAYRHLMRHGVVMNPANHPGLRVRRSGRLGVELAPGGFLCRFAKEFPDFDARFFGDLDDAWHQFLLFRKAYETDKVLKKRAA